LRWLTEELEKIREDHATEASKLVALVKVMCSALRDLGLGPMGHVPEAPRQVWFMFSGAKDTLPLLRDLKGVFAAARVLEGERLIALVVRYLIACYRSTDPNFSLGPALAGARKEGLNVLRVELPELFNVPQIG
jgi:hypothetical protein